MSEYIEAFQDEISRIQQTYIIVIQTFSGLRLTRLQLARLLISQIWRELSPSSVFIITLFVLVPPLSWIISRLFSPHKSLQSLGIPLLGKSKGAKMDFVRMMDDAANKHPNEPCLITAFGTEYVVFPSKYFDEVKRLPAAKASAQAFMREAFHETWSGIPRHSSELKKAIFIDLSRSIPALVQDRQQDCAAASDQVLGHCAHWKEVTLYSAMEDIVVTTNASAFVGRDLGTKKEWKKTVARLPLAVAIPTVILSFVPVMLRPLLKPFVFAPAIWMRHKLLRMLTPVLEQDMRGYSARTDKTSLTGVEEQGRIPLTTWLLRRYPQSVKDVRTRLMDDYINASFESTPSSAGTLFYIVVELAADPALADLLREEIDQLAPDGQLPLTHLNELKRMDSVMRESSRVNPFSSLTLYRKLQQPVQLSIGPELPAGTNICVDAHHINFSSQLWDEPERFDGLRHYRARMRAGNEMRFKFANVGSDAPGWGDGTQACPGRIFADNTLKIILTHLLLNYDIRLRMGEAKPKRGSMPNGSFYPDMKAKVQIKSRKV
ncbi:cytochrome P450 oxidoreductase GliF [Xylaria flabelliformis]|nr:cytochrome P450 oxidoreductase GliF [Xylaria flabelliformis]